MTKAGINSIFETVTGYHGFRFIPKAVEPGEVYGLWNTHYHARYDRRGLSGLNHHPAERIMLYFQHWWPVVPEKRPKVMIRQYNIGLPNRRNYWPFDCQFPDERMPVNWDMVWKSYQYRKPFKRIHASYLSAFFEANGFKAVSIS